MGGFIRMFAVTAMCAVGIWAQDIIYMRNGSEIKAKVLRSYTIMGNVEFVLSSNGQNSSIPVKEVEWIQYADGHRVSYVCSGCVNANQGVKYLASTSTPAQNSFTQEHSEASTGQTSIKPSTGAGDKDYEKRQKQIVKYTNDLQKIEKTLAEINQTAPATFGVASLSVELLKTLNRTQEQKNFELDAILPLISKATFMTLPPNTISPSARIDTNVAAKLFPWLTADFDLSQNKAVAVINSALESWNGKSIYDIKNEMGTVPPAQKVKIALLLKYSTGVFATAIPQLKFTIKANR